MDPMQPFEPPHRHGFSPFSTVVLHGGPGAPGSAQGLAAGLGTLCGVLEPFQSAPTIDALLDELKETLERYADNPVSLIGHSWGAWLALLFAARHPGLVKKLILVSSPPFETVYVPRISETRFSRLGADGQELFRGLVRGALSGAKLKRVGALVARADAFDLLPEETSDPVPPDPAQYERIWKEAAELRRNGALLEAAHSVQCPITALHGDWDPHPAEGVREPLLRVVKGLKFILLERCGHEPWKERFAREAFFKALRAEV